MSAPIFTSWPGCDSPAFKMANAQQNFSIRIGDHLIGHHEPVFVIAEAGVNHDGRVELAMQLVEAAVQAGAEAIKFQTFNAEALVTASAPKAAYQIETTSSQDSQLEMLRKLELPLAAYAEIRQHCQQLGIMFLSTPFDETAADFLDQLEVPAFKISSGDITNIPLLQYVARKGKPVILSTGMSEMHEVASAVQTIRTGGCEDLVLLQCVSNYPANPSDVNLRAMQTMADAFDVPVGYSDHTAGIEIALAAVALGACVIEKHFTLDKNAPGPDHRASLAPQELAEMIKGIRNVEAALGDGRKAPAASEADTARAARRSLAAAQDIAAGTQLTRDMIAIQRPGTGLSPELLSSLVGRTVRVHVPAGCLLSLEMLNSRE
jgi:N,N'-diacetyllegionaminate synthase